MQADRGMALCWIDCGTVADNITTSRLDLRFSRIQERPNRTGFACVPRQHLCSSVDIWVHLCLCFFLGNCRTGHDRDVSCKSKGKHRYTQISTDKHRWTTDRIARPEVHQGMAFGTPPAASPQFRPNAP